MFKHFFEDWNICNQSDSRGNGIFLLRISADSIHSCIALRKKLPWKINNIHVLVCCSLNLMPTKFKISFYKLQISVCNNHFKFKRRKILYLRVWKATRNCWRINKKINLSARAYCVSTMNVSSGKAWSRAHDITCYTQGRPTHHAGMWSDRQENVVAIFSRL